MCMPPIASPPSDCQLSTTLVSSCPYYICAHLIAHPYCHLHLQIAHTPLPTTSASRSCLPMPTATLCICMLMTLPLPPAHPPSTHCPATLPTHIPMAAHIAHVHTDDYTSASRSCLSMPTAILHICMPATASLPLDHVHPCLWLHCAHAY